MKNDSRVTRRRGARRTVAVAGAVGASMALLAPLASAAPTPAPVPGGGVCDPAIAQGCLTVLVESGTFANNGFNLPIGLGDMIIAGNAPDDDFIPRDDGHNGVYGKPLTVPGGVLGVDLPFNNLFGLAAVTATVEAVEVPVFNGNLFDFDMTLNTRMKIDNPFLGDNCYIGSESDPVVLDLDLTNPDDDPVVWDYATYPGIKAGNIQNTATNFTLPGATGCGPFGILNPIVNWRAKVPAESGTSLKTKSSGFLTESAAGGTDPLDGSDDGNGSSGSSGSSGSDSSSGSSGS